MKGEDKAVRTEEGTRSLGSFKESGVVMTWRMSATLEGDVALWIWGHVARDEDGGVDCCGDTSRMEDAFVVGGV